MTEVLYTALKDTAESLWLVHIMAAVMRKVELSYYDKGVEIDLDIMMVRYPLTCGHSIGR
jgi:hypothetical protein